ncbi:MAG TPA: uroporphyrinogen decarboxylase family protein, partial [Candidatus Brocadiia bacterium]|nr:uroporphyrinogen decarboxylase family protein [Candidatus Brocadiia bacterium]
MPAMTPRERLRAALSHKEPDRVPYDLASTQVTGISRAAHDRLRSFLGLPQREAPLLDVMQQVVIPQEDLLGRLEVDTRGVYPLVSTNWNVVPRDEGDAWIIDDEWGCRHRKPKDGGHYFSLVQSPLDDAVLSADAVAAHKWPDPADPRRWAGLRQRALELRAAGFPVVMKGFCAGILEMACRVRPMDKFMMDLALDETAAAALLNKIAELKTRFWTAALEEMGDVVDVVAEADDYGTQESMLVSPGMYRRLLKPLQAAMFAQIRKRLKNGFIFFHSCGNVRGLIPDFIEIGVDILNPVHVTAAGMEPSALKRDFGRDICFWGGGVDTQGVLPRGAPAQVKEDVKRNIAALAPGGGFVFNTIHNIQADVPPQNIMAMWEALREAG